MTPTKDEIIEQARIVRAAQREYYNSRGDKSLLITSKQVERTLDDMLKAYDEAQNAGQQPLFGGLV